MTADERSRSVLAAICIGARARGRQAARDVPALDSEDPMPQLLTDGLPNRQSRSKFDFTAWADGQAWKFVKGEDYLSSTETFRYNVRRWARQHGYEPELRPYPAVDRDGRDLPLSKADAIAIGIKLTAAAA
jgi:hypothetical protein